MEMAKNISVLSSVVNQVGLNLPAGITKSQSAESNNSAMANVSADILINYMKRKQQKANRLKYQRVWQRGKRDRDRLVRLKEIYFTEVSPILKNIKPIK
jgi:ABC-type Fe3+-citrate transport system substrate-binding protein